MPRKRYIITFRVFDDLSSDRYISSKYLCVSPNLQICLFAGVTKAMAAYKTRFSTEHNGGKQLASDTFTCNARAFLVRYLFVHIVVIRTPLVSRPYVRRLLSIQLSNQSVQSRARQCLRRNGPFRAFLRVSTRPAPSNCSRVTFAFRADQNSVSYLSYLKIIHILKSVMFRRR